MKVGLLKTSLVNFPGRVCAAVFLPGCNLRCPFCHNGELACAPVATGPSGETGETESYVEIEEAYAHLEKRSRVLGGLAISGGEPFLSPALPDLIRKARNLGLQVKIDTNGTLTDRLKTFLADPELRPDMIAVDVKTSLSRYGELAIEERAGPRLAEELRKTLQILKDEALCGGNASLPLRVEYRTVLVPGLVGEKELREIASLLPESADWELAGFISGVCLDPAWNEKTPYGPEETLRLASLAQSLIPGAKLR